MTTNAEYQASRNGPLTEETREYLKAVKSQYRWSYKYVGELLGISEAFAYNLIMKGGNVSTDTYYASVAAGIERLKAGETQLPEANETDKLRVLDHSYHLRDGFQMAFKLPADLTEREAERLGLFIRSLAQ